MAAIFYPPRWQHSRCQIALKFSIYAELRTISISFQLLSFPRALSSYVSFVTLHIMRMPAMPRTVLRVLLLGEFISFCLSYSSRLISFVNYSGDNRSMFCRYGLLCKVLASANDVRHTKLIRRQCRGFRSSHAQVHSCKVL